MGAYRILSSVSLESALGIWPSMRLPFVCLCACRAQPVSRVTCQSSRHPSGLWGKGERGTYQMMMLDRSPISVGMEPRSRFWSSSLGQHAHVIPHTGLSSVACELAEPGSVWQ